MKSTLGFGFAIALLLFTMNVSWAATAEETIQICKAAIAEAEGSDYNDAALKKIKPRRNSYEAWFNVSDGERQLKSYCYVKRSEVEALITSEGRWTGSNPKRPEASQPS